METSEKLKGPPVSLAIPFPMIRPAFATRLIFCLRVSVVLCGVVKEDDGEQDKHKEGKKRGIETGRRRRKRRMFVDINTEC